ncbi:MAG TPA: glycosyltransferase family 2 protein [Microvirga sp.]|nr:glycosyltransferase family 2 protein [Microvirga sp.]
MEPLISGAPLPTPLSGVVCAVIPCLDEEAAIGAVVRGVRAQGVVEVVVVDGGSRDRTAEVAHEAGARIVLERRRGYGRALRTGIAALPSEADIVLFIDGDGSDRPEFIPDLIRPIAEGRAAFAHGSRTRGEREAGSLSPPQLLAGWLAGVLIRVTYGVRFTDMSPYRAIHRDALDRLGMREDTYGWNLEMLMRVAAAGLPAVEIPVGQRRRAGGVSKVSGNLRASLRAAAVIAATFTRLALELRRSRPDPPGAAHDSAR